MKTFVLRTALLKRDDNNFVGGAGNRPLLTAKVSKGENGERQIVTIGEVGIE